MGLKWLAIHQNFSLQTFISSCFSFEIYGQLNDSFIKDFPYQTFALYSTLTLTKDYIHICEDLHL